MRLTPDFQRTLRRYVLGDLEEDVQSELEELLVTDSDAFEALGVIEEELIEEYLEESGSATERRRFERHFLTSPERVGRLRFARALKSRAPAPTPRLHADTHPSRTSSVGFSLWRPAWVGLAAALAMSLAGNVWQASRLRAPEKPASASFALAAGLLRAGGSLPRLTVPADAVVVRLGLELPANDYPLYRAVLLDGEGDEIWTVSKVRAEEVAGQTAVVLVLPSQLLPRGDYQAKLSGLAANGDREALASYPFRVTLE